MDGVSWRFHSGALIFPMCKLLPEGTTHDSEEGCFVEFTLRILDSFAADGKKRPFLMRYHARNELHVWIYLRS